MTLIFLKYHLKKYPLMNNQDIIKLVYQEVMGPNHIIKSYEMALKYITNELNDLYNTNNNLYEYLGNNYVRMDIHNYFKYYNNLDSLCDLFISSLCDNDNKNELEETLTSLLSPAELKGYNYLPVSHSEAFRNAYLPHYRIIKSSLLTLEHRVIQLSNFMDKLPNKSIVALEGRCASGKSSICDKIKDRYTVIPIDDFFLPSFLKNKERLEEIGGNINYELVKDTLINLKESLRLEKLDITYKAFDCSRQEYYEKTIKIKDKIILEGVYSSSPYFRELIDKIMYLYVDSKTQLKRINNRFLKERFIKEWIPLEEKYFEYIKIDEICDLII